MSNILVIMPTEWIRQDMDEMARLTGFTFSYFQGLQSGNMMDLNERLLAAEYFQDEKRVVDVQVINEQVYFRFE